MDICLGFPLAAGLAPVRRCFVLECPLHSTAGSVSPLPEGKRKKQNPPSSQTQWKLLDCSELFVRVKLFPTLRRGALVAITPTQMCADTK